MLLEAVQWALALLRLPHAKSAQLPDVIDAASDARSTEPALPTVMAVELERILVICRQASIALDADPAQCRRLRNFQVLGSA